MLYEIADLFCGAGGTSTGASQALAKLGFKHRVTAINHWDTAVSTHAANHPDARHLCTGVDDVDPRKLYKPGELHILWASPECTHHSRARGGKPMSDQSRATGHCVIRWAEALLPPIIMVENVKEFLDWGPLDSKGRPMKSKKGATFRAWVGMLQSLGYRVDWRVLKAADYGDPTTRERLFIQAVRGRRKIVWPNRTHAPADEIKKLRDGDLFGLTLKPYVPAKAIIDWGLPSTSIFDREANGKRPLSPKTMKRIMVGLQKYGLKAFIVEPGHGDHEGRVPQHRTNSIDDPLGTVPCANRFGVAQPFIVAIDHHGGNSDQLRSVENPLSTISTKARHCVVEPFLIDVAHGDGCGRGNTGRAKSIDQPVGALPCTNRFGIAEPYLVEFRGTSLEQVERSARTIHAPLSPVTTSGAHHGLVQPFLVATAHDGNGRIRSIDEPMPTVCGNRGDLAVCEPSLLPQQSGGSLRRVSEPVPTVAAAGAIGLVEPFIVPYYGTATAASINEPLDTVTTTDRFGLAMPEVVIKGKTYLVDIRFRMLQPHELAAAQGFPTGYTFVGNKTESVKQIGNAVPPGLARALVLAAVTQNPDIASFVP